MRLVNSVLVFICMLVISCSPSGKSVKYASNADGFSVYFPATPKTSVKQDLTTFGKQAVHYVTWKPGTFDINKLKLLQVSYTDCPRSASADSVRLNITLDSSINMIKREYTELEVRSEAITIEGYPGRAFIFQSEKENSTTIVKQLLANNRIYTLTAVAKKDYPTNDELNKFFDTFLILR